METGRDGGTFRRTHETWAAYAVLAVFAYIETALGPAMPFVRSHLGLGYTVASLHFAAFAAGSMAVGFFIRRIFPGLGAEPRSGAGSAA